MKFHSGDGLNLTRLDRYLLSRMMTLFGFFALVLVSIYWVNRAVSMSASLMADGQTAAVVLEFIALTLPYVIRIVMPVAAFAATIHAFNRLEQDSELVVMRATGVSSMRLGRPVLVFGLILSVMMAALVNFLAPAAQARLADRRQEVAQNVTARLLTEGNFQHPSDGVTIYIRKITALGELEGFFLSDARDPKLSTTYTAARALIVKTGTGPRLIMFDGMVQSLQRASDRLSVTRFSNFTYDLSQVLKKGTPRQRGLEEITTPRLIRANGALHDATGPDRALVRLQIQRRISQPLLAPVGALIGFAALMMGTFSRFGMWRRMMVAIAGMVLVQMLQNICDSAAKNDPLLWPVLYIPATAGTLAALIMVWLSQRPKCSRPGPACVATPA